MTQIYPQKIHVPARRIASYTRPSVIDILEQAAKTRQSLLLHAPTGWGKTTALLNWITLRSPDIPVQWYTLDARDHDPSVFLHHLLVCLSYAYPVLSSLIPPRTTSPQSQTSLTIIRQIVAVLASTPSTSILVFDKIDALDELPDAESHPLFMCIDQILALTAVPIILTATTVPPICVRHVVQGQLRIIDRTELAWDATDSSAVARSFYDHALAPQVAQDLVAWAGGWPAALSLALENWSRHGFVPSHSPLSIPDLSVHYLFPFLEHQVFAPLPAAMQHFLVATSVLSELTVDACNELCGSTNAALFLQELRAHGWFSIGVGDVVSYHDLFRQFLRSLLHTKPDEERHLLQRALQIALRDEEYGAAFTYLMELDDVSEAVKLVQRVGPLLRQRGQYVRLQHWLATLQQQTKLPPDLLLFWAKIATDMADWTTTAAMIRLAMIGGDRSIHLEARLLEASVACLRQESRHADLIMRGIEIQELPPSLRTQGLETAGRIALAQRRFGDAINYFQEALSITLPLELADTDPPAHLYDLLGMSLALHNDSAAAAYYLEQANALWQMLNAPARQMMTLNNLAALAIEEGRLDDASRYGHAALGLAEHYEQVRGKVLIVCALAEIALLRAQFADAMEHFRIAYHYAQTASLAGLQAYCAAGALRSAVLHQDDDARNVWQAHIDQLPSNGVAAQTAAVMFASALAESDHQSAAYFLDQVVGEQMSTHHDRAHYTLLRVQIAFERGGWLQAEADWQALEALRPRRHVDLLLQTQLRRTPDLLNHVPTTSLSRRLWTEPSTENCTWRIAALGQFVCQRPPQLDPCAFRPIDQLVVVRLLEAGPAGMDVLALWEDIWGDRSYSSDALRQSMARIRRTSSIDVRLRNGHCQLQLAWDTIVYDVALFETPIQRMTPEEASMIEQRLALYSGPFLSHLHHESPWLHQRRRILHHHALALRERLGLLTEPTDPQRAQQWYSSVLEDDPCREVAAAGVMRCSTKLGNRLYGVMIYQQTCTALMEHLGVEPSPLLNQVYRDML